MIRLSQSLPQQDKAVLGCPVTCTDNEHFGLCQLLLPFKTNLRKDKVTGMPLHIDHVDAY
jgi:hypothetical protein